MKRIIIALATFLATGASAEVMALRNLAIGDSHASFCAEQLNGPQICSDTFADTILIAAFLRPDQKKSLKVTGSLKDLYTKYKTQGVFIVGILSGDDIDQEIALPPDKEPVTFPLLLDPDRSIYGSFGVFVYPTIVVFGQDGTLKYVFNSNTLNIGKRLEGCIRYLLGEIEEAELETIIHPVVEKIDHEQAKAERYYNFARTAFDREDFSKARTIVESTLNEHIAHAPTHVLYGHILVEEGDFEGALKQFEEALTIAPDLEEAHAGRQRCLDQLNR